MLIQKAIQRCTISVVLIIIILAIACDQDDKPTSPASDKVRVTGTISSWTCRSVEYPSPSADFRYAVDGQAAAKVAFVDSLGHHDSCLTDDSSKYVIYVRPGTYDIILETGHSFPDTLTGVAVTHDTAVNLSFRIGWLDADSIQFGILFDPPSDSIGEASERAYLMFLNDRVGNMLEIDSATRRSNIYDYGPPVMYVSYNLTINSNYRMWEVLMACYPVLEEYQSFFPEYVDLYPRVFICMDGQPNGRADQWQDQRLDRFSRIEIATGSR